MGRSWAAWANLGSLVFQSWRPKRPTPFEFSQTLCQIRPAFGKPLPCLVEVGQSLANFGKTRPKLSPSRPRLAESGLNPGSGSTCSTTVRPSQQKPKQFCDHGFSLNRRIPEVRTCPAGPTKRTPCCKPSRPPPLWRCFTSIVGPDPPAVARGLEGQHLGAFGWLRRCVSKWLSGRQRRRESLSV